jgi:hypothetical protein
MKPCQVISHQPLIILLIIAGFQHDNVQIVSGQLMTGKDSAK